MAVRPQVSDEVHTAAAGSVRPSAPIGPRSRRRESWGVALLLLLALAVRLPTLNQPLIEKHAFRQTQTAYTAVLFHEHGVDLLHPKLPIFGAPFEVPFEFPLFQALAAGVMSWGLAPDTAMRVTALAFFLLSSLLLWGLVRHVGGRVAAMVTLALFLFSPFALEWSRASMIEYLAVAGALGWLWAGLLWRERRRMVYASAALVAGVVVMLVKPTTGAFWILPLLAFATASEGPGWRAWLRARRDPVLVAIVCIPFLAAAAWTHHADAIKAASDSTAFLTSSAMTEWNFGTLHQRMIGANWGIIASRFTHDFGFPAWLLLLAPFVGLRTRNARFWGALALVPVVTILVFWHLYTEHDYYLAAISPVPAAVVGYAVSRARPTLAGRRVDVRLAAMVGVLIVALLALNPTRTTQPYQDLSVAEVYPIVAEITQLTRPSDLIMFEEPYWNPTVLYYARRQGHVILDIGPPRVLPSRLVRDGYRMLVSVDVRNEVAMDAIRAGRWTGVLGRWTFITGDSAAELRGAPIAGTDDPLETAGPSLLDGPVTIPCGHDPVALPRSDGETVLRLAAGTDDRARLSIGEDFGAIPVRDNILIGAGAGNGPLLVGCRGAPTVTIVDVSRAAASL